MKATRSHVYVLLLRVQRVGANQDRSLRDVVHAQLQRQLHNVAVHRARMQLLVAAPVHDHAVVKHDVLKTLLSRLLVLQEEGHVLRDETCVVGLLHLVAELDPVENGVVHDLNAVVIHRAHVLNVTGLCSGYRVARIVVVVLLRRRQERRVDPVPEQHVALSVLQRLVAHHRHITVDGLVRGESQHAGNLVPNYRLRVPRRRVDFVLSLVDFEYRTVLR